MALQWLGIICFIVLICLCFCQVINRPPSLTKIFEPEYYIQIDHSTPVTVQCEATNGDITYQWRKDNVAVRNSRQVAVDAKLGTITFTRIEYEDYGTYQCFASNQYGTALSPPIKIKEARLGSFPIEPVTQDCTEYQECLIQCRNRPKCEPAAECRVEWKKGPGTDYNVRVSERIAVDGKGNLHILNVKQEDWDGQEYGCGLWNEVTKTFTKGSMTSLNIIKSTPKLIEPKAVYNSVKVKAVLRQSATLQCIFAGSPIPSITWKTPHLDLINFTRSQKYELADYGRKLLVKNITFDDEGYYTCIANNKVQQQSLLNVTSPPYLNPQNKNPQMLDSYVSAGKNAAFYCDVMSVPGEDPPSLPIWKKNGRDIGASQVGVEYLVSQDMKELTVLDVMKATSARPGSTGSYQCVSENSEGMIFKDAFLAVIDPIKILLRPEKSYRVDRESLLSLAVDAVTDPALNLRYRWRFTDSNNITINVANSASWMLSNDNKNLTINTQGLDKEEFFRIIGRYTIEVYHSYDAEFVHIDVVTNVLTIPQEPPAEANLWFLGIIFGVIILIIVIILIVCMLYHNTCKSGTYPVDEKEVAAGHDPEKELADSGFHDLSRADEDGHKMDNISLSDDFGKQIESDEDSMGEYGGDLDISKFNEDGSFIGIYADKLTHNTKQSTV
ncbi:neuroglian-like isoform X3 [Ostrea edulis]|uniref:neuroglian-like isoform X3 n=1 Tax=Ostrea edulis TaxID=37623 RepID=UPI0024AFDB48|nr:neuroglian-like isoform X3 [Ostrea edulis]